MNDSNRQSLPTNYTSGPPAPLTHAFGGTTTVDSWMTTSPSAGQSLPSYANLPNLPNQDFDVRQGYHSGIPSPGPQANGAPNFMHHSYIQQPYLNSKYGSAPDYSQNHFNPNLYNSYANNYVSKVDITSKHTDGSDAGNDTHMEEVCGSDGNTAEGLTARLLDKNSDNTPIGSHSPSSQDSGSNSVGYRPWEQPGADGQPLAQDQTNAQQIQSHPNRPSSAQSDKQQQQTPQPPHPSQQRTTPSPARRTGRSPSAQQFSDNHTIEKYQTLTPVPPIPPISAPYNTVGMYGQPPPGVYPNHLGVAPYMQTQFSGFPAPDGKTLKMGVNTEPDSSTPDVRMGALENSFQVPSVSSTTRPTIGGIPQPSATPPHPQTAQQVVSIHPTPQTMVEHWEGANQIPVPQNGSQQPPGEGEKVTKKKRKRCGECPGCLKKDNCGECGPCKSVRSHQICKMRKCDQLKTKKEKVREAAQMAAAAAASGLTLTKDMTALDGSSRNLNGTTISTPFTNLGPSDPHSAGVGPTPRASYPEFSASKQPNINQVFDSNAQTFPNFHMNSQPITGPFNGHGLVSEVIRPHHSPENNVNSDNTHQNRHQIMNNRLKTLIQSRQNQKELNNGQNNHNFSSGTAQTAQTPSFAGQTFIVVQQQTNANNPSLSPHYGNTSVPPNTDSGQSFLHMNWSQQESEDNTFHKNSNGVSDKIGGVQTVQTTGRRTPYNAIELQNGSIYQSFNNNSQFNSTNDNQNHSNNNITNNNNNKNTNNNKNILNTSPQQFIPTIPTTTYSSNQSQSFTSSAAQEYSSNDTNTTLPANQSRQQTQRPNSRSSPGRAVNSSPASNGTKPMVTTTEPMAIISANGVNASQLNDQNIENESFLVNTTTTMHHNLNHNHNLSDLTTSMNTSTGIINSYNLSPHSQSSAFYPSSLYMPSMGLLGPSSPNVIMSVSGTGLDSSKKSLEERQSSVGHMISGIDCGRIDIEPLDSTSGLNLLDLTAMTSFIKSDPSCDSTSSSSPLLMSNESHYTMTSLGNAEVNTTTTVLPPVSTFLLPNFRDQNWWDRNLDKLKANTKDINDCECYPTDEREYNRSTSPSSLTTLSASLSN